MFFKGKLTLIDSNLEIDGHRIVVEGDCKLKNTDCSLVYSSPESLQSSLFVMGSLEQNASDINIRNGYLSVASDYVILNDSVLIMEHSHGYVRVGKDFLTLSTGDENGHLIDGTMEFLGNFSQGGNCNSFLATCCHEAIFSGYEKQVISFANPDSSKFNKKVVINDVGIIELDGKVTAVTITQNFLLGMLDSVISIREMVDGVIDDPMGALEGMNLVSKAISPLGMLTGENKVFIEGIICSAEKYIEEIADGNENVVARKLGKIVGDILISIIADKGAGYAKEAIGKLQETAIKSSDDLIKNGIINVDDLLEKGVASADDLKKLGFSSADDLVKLKITNEES